MRRWAGHRGTGFLLRPVVLASVEHEMLVVMNLRLRPGGGLEAPFTWLTSLLFCPCLVVNFNNRAKVKKKTQRFRKRA